MRLNAFTIPQTDSDGDPLGAGAASPALLARWERRLAAPSPFLVAALVFGLGLMVAPWTYHRIDMIVYGWLPWARASAGSRPWDIYRASLPFACDYPPFVPYLLTLAERLRLLLHAPEVGPVAVILVKLPNMMAHLLGALLCWRGLCGPLGDQRGRAIAVLYALCPPLLVNAALWGQFDALLSLAMVAAVVALIRGRPGWAGAALGWALAIKLQAIAVVPVLFVFAARRHGVRGVLAGMAAGSAVLTLLAAPHVLGGGGSGMMAAYRGAVDYFPVRTLTANNGWYLLDRWDIYVRNLSADVAASDARPALGPFTFKQVGLLGFAVYTFFLAAAVWRRPTRYGLALVAATSIFAFFMLPTQMHERYVLPAVPLLTLVALSSRRALLLWLWISVSATLSQSVVLAQHNALYGDYVLPPLLRLGLQLLTAAGAVGNVAMFVFATGAVWREAFVRPANAPDLLAPPPVAVSLAASGRGSPPTVVAGDTPTLR